MENVPQESEQVETKAARELQQALQIAEEVSNEGRIALFRAPEQGKLRLKEVRLRAQEQTPAEVVSEAQTADGISTPKDATDGEISNIKYSAFVTAYFHLLSSQERNDLGTQAHKYWVNRLFPEIDILPESIASVLKQIASRKHSVEVNSAFDSYISRRQSILKFNVEKRAIMDALKKRLRDIDAHVDYSEEERAKRRSVFYDKESKRLFVNEGGKKKQLTYGDVVADLDWGVSYQPDESCPREIWRRIRKLSDLSRAQQDISKIFNQEIASLEKISLPTTDLDEEFIEKHMSDHPYIHGVIGERMAKNILMRISYNNPGMLLRVESSNAIEDVELKYDFKILMPKKTRGVALEGEDMSREEFVKHKRRLGIQFTVTGLSYRLNKKRRAIKIAQQKINDKTFNRYVKRMVDDIVLVSVPLKTYKDCFKQWLESGKPSGGPEQFLSEEGKNHLVNAVLSSVPD